jgi:Ser/Thr protein kinase RdoA (MazF antagonist)
MKDYYQRRISYKGDIEKVLVIVCKDFSLGNFKSSKIITAGYEDFNVVVKTTRGKYLVKIFADFRDYEDCKRYVDIMLRSLEAGVKLPKLMESNQKHLNIVEIGKTKLKLCVMEFISGDSFFNLGVSPNIEDIRFIAHQTSLINSINIKPPFVYDSWAIINFLPEFKEKGKYLTSEDLKSIQPLIEEFQNIDIKKLPHCFVHGDVIKTNIMKDDKQQNWIIDFAVANYYPRIVEMAVLNCDLLFNENSKTISQNNFNIALDEYQKTVSLTSAEMEALPVFTRTAHAMHVIRTFYEKRVNNNNSKENKYFLKKGRLGLKQMTE